MGGWFGISLGVGIAIALQVAVVGRASSTAPPLAVSLALQIAGLLAGAIWAIGQHGFSQLPPLMLQWWWLPIGALGWGIVAALGAAVERGGVTATLAVVVAAQLTSGLGLDRVAGNITLGPRHLVGIALLVVGVILVSTRP